MNKNKTIIVLCGAYLRNNQIVKIRKFIKRGELKEETSVGIFDESSGERKPKFYNFDMIIVVCY